MKTLLLYGGIASILLLIAGIPPGFPAEEQEARDSFVDIRGNVVTEEGNPVATLSVRCKDSQQAIVREVLTNAQGEFTLTHLPSHIGTIDCEAGDDRLYAKAHKQIPVLADTQVTFTLDFQMLDQVQGWITVPKGLGIENALVQITRNGATVSRRSTADGKVTFENLKAGPATITYSAEGVPTMEVPGVLIAQGSDLSASLPFDWSPLGLILLIPAILVLMTRAGMEGFWRRCRKEHSCLASLILILIALALWGITFGWVWYALSDKTSYSLDYFHPELSFSLAVPVFGFLGALLFVVDAFLKGKRDPDTHMEFVMRLVLGPYVAIVMVVLLRNTFDSLQVSEKIETQAMISFFSGFLVVLVLQALSEKGNEILGKWRNASRYEPTEIARKFRLDLEDDLKLKKVNLKYLSQLRELGDPAVEQLANQSELSQGLLAGLRNRAVRAYLKARIGEGVWKKLEQQGIKTVWDLAPLTPAQIQDLSAKHEIDPAALTKYADEAKKLLGIP